MGLNQQEDKMKLRLKENHTRHQKLNLDLVKFKHIKTRKTFSTLKYFNLIVQVLLLRKETKEML